MPRFSSDDWSEAWSRDLLQEPEANRGPGLTVPMDRLSMNEVTTYRWGFDEDLYHYRHAGYAGVGVWLRKLQDYGEERGLELLRESGLTVSNVVWAGGFTGSDGASAGESLRHARRAIDLAGAMRAGSLVIYTGGRNRHTKRHASRLLDAALDELLPAAEAARTPLAIEPVNPACAASWSILTSLGQTLELVERYDTPWLQIALDTYHFPMLHGDRGLLADLAPRLAVVHLADLAAPHCPDEERCPLGEGVAPIHRIVSTLVENGYRGFFDVELCGSAIESEDYNRLLMNTRLEFTQVASAEASSPSEAALKG